MAEEIVKLGRQKSIFIDTVKELLPVEGYSVVHLWSLICLSLGLLSPNEREYLGDDLKEILVFHPETAM
jgi:hypothetical protein